MKPLPEGWEAAPIGDIARVDTGTTPPKKDPSLYGQDLPFIKPPDLQGTQITTHSEALSPKGAEQARLAPEGSVLVTCIGNLGRTGLAVEATAFNQQINAIFPTKAWLTKYVNYSVMSPQFQSDIAGASSGTTISIINKSRFSALKLPVPPLNEQRRIVDKVDALFAHSKKAKASLDRIPALLEKLKKSILAAAFRGDLTKDWREAHPDVEPADKLLERIRTERRRRWEEADEERRVAAKRFGHDLGPGRFPDPEDRPIPRAGLPTGWTWTTLDTLTHFTVDYRGRTPPKAASGIPLVSSAAVKPDAVLVGPSGFVSEETYAASLTRGVPRPGDLLLTTEAPVGVAALVPEDLHFLPSRRVFACKLSCVNPRYVMFAISSSEAVKHLEAHGRGTTVPRILKPDLLAVPIPLPPRAEQDEVVRTIDAALSKARHAEMAGAAQGQRLGLLDQAILAKAFRGELVPQDPNDEPASVLLERIRAEREATAKTKPKATRRRTRATKPPEPASEPEPPAATAKPPAPNQQPDLPFNQDFLDLDPHEQAHAAATTLFGAGPLPKAEALRHAAEGLRTLGLSEHQRLRSGGKLHTALDKSITNGVRLGLFDRPARGQVRAIKPDASGYTSEEWRLCIDAVADEADDEDTLIRRAADWAQAQLGLSFARLRKDGHIYTGLQSAYRRPKDTAS